MQITEAQSQVKKFPKNLTEFEQLATEKWEKLTKPKMHFRYFVQFSKKVSNKCLGVVLNANQLTEKG